MPSISSSKTARSWTLPSDASSCSTAVSEIKWRTAGGEKSNCSAPRAQPRTRKNASATHVIRYAIQATFTTSLRQTRGCDPPWRMKHLAFPAPAAAGAAKDRQRPAIVNPTGKRACAYALTAIQEFLDGVRGSVRGLSHVVALRSRNITQGRKPPRRSDGENTLVRNIRTTDAGSSCVTLAPCE